MLVGDTPNLICSQFTEVAIGRLAILCTCLCMYAHNTTMVIAPLLHNKTRLYLARE